MNAYLLDHPNPNAPVRDNGRRGFYYTTRRRPILAITIHITAGAEDLDAHDDGSAESTAAYAASTERAVSWHRGSDSDSWLPLLPDRFTAFHVAGYNSATLGLEISKRDVTWGDEPRDWVEATIRQAADACRSWVADHAVPLRRASRDDLDRAIARFDRYGQADPVGFVGHAQLDPSRRRDPGADFPWDGLFRLIEEDTVPWTLSRGDQGPQVEAAQHRLDLACGHRGIDLADVGDWPNDREDAKFGGATEAVVNRWLGSHGQQQDGVIDAFAWGLLIEDIAARGLVRLAGRLEDGDSDDHSHDGLATVEHVATEVGRVQGDLVATRRAIKDAVS